MARSIVLSQWIEMVSTRLPHLSKPMATVLAMWSFGMVMKGRCGLTTIADFLSERLDLKMNSVRQRLREWYWDAADKQGQKRRQLEVHESFAPLLRWVLNLWPSDEKRVALAMDATSLKQVFTVLTISVVYRACAIPVAWAVVGGNAKGSWKPHWLTLFQHLAGSIPTDYTVIVMADRGLYAHWLFKQIVAIGWHPCLRINTGGKCRLRGDPQWRPFTEFVRDVGAWADVVTCFKSHPVDCTLITIWEQEHTDPWLIITDLEPDQANIHWYSLRTWIECGFKDTKRGGLQWQYTRITDPERANRFWLALAVATLWALCAGTEAEETTPASNPEALPETHIARRRATHSPARRVLSCFSRGLTHILNEALSNIIAPCERLVPEPWPAGSPLGG